MNTSQSPISNKFLLAVVGICLVTVSICGWFLLKGQRASTYQPYAKIPDIISETDKKKSARAETKCIKELKYYDSQALGIVFCYPGTWGNATMTDARLSTTDKGTRLLIGFTAKQEIKLGFVSSDWTSAASHETSCAEPVKTMPSSTGFSTHWRTAAGGASAYRGIEMLGDSYYLEEIADTLLGGVCLRGYVSPDIQTYGAVKVSYYREFGAGIINADMHVKNPLILVPEVDRQDLRTLMLSIEKY